MKISPKNKIIDLNLDWTLKMPFELKKSEKDPSIQLIKEYSEIEKIYKAKKMGFLYIHRKKIQNLLYDLDKIKILIQVIILNFLISFIYYY
jgi:hypothetical protein